MKFYTLVLLFALQLSAINAEKINPRHLLAKRLAASSASPPASPAAVTTTTMPSPPPQTTPANSLPPSSQVGTSAAPPATPPAAPGATTPTTSSATTTPAVGASTAVSTSATPTGPPPLATYTGVPPLANISSGMPTRNPIPDTTTYLPGATPPIHGAPALPTSITLGSWPPQDKVPDTSSDEVRQWLTELNGYNIPNLSTTVDGSCASDPAAAADAANRGWWTCGGYTRATDVVACPEKFTWGVSFDDGPSAYTQYLLDYLSQKDINATFFVVGSRVIERPDVLIEEYMSGHEISVHTWSHRALTTLTNEQIVAELGWTRKAIKDVLGVTPTTMRPPYGDIDDRVRAISLAMGMVPIMWTNSPNGGKFDTNDWRVAGGTVANGTDSFNAFEAILGNATTLDTGFIVLQHDLFEITVDLAVGYTLDAALNHQPKFDLMAIGECLNFPAGNLYLETNVNTTFPYRNTTTGGGVDVDGNGAVDSKSTTSTASSSKGKTSAALTHTAPFLMNSITAIVGFAVMSLLL